METKTLTMKNLVTLFGVTAMTVYSWRRGTATKEAMPETLTPAAVKRWAKRHEVAMTCEASTLLGTGVLKRGPKPKPLSLIPDFGAAYPRIAAWQSKALSTALKSKHRGNGKATLRAVKS